MRGTIIYVFNTIFFFIHEYFSLFLSLSLYILQKQVLCVFLSFFFSYLQDFTVIVNWLCAQNTYKRERHISRFDTSGLTMTEKNMIRCKYSDLSQNISTYTSLWYILISTALTQSIFRFVYEVLLQP